jgi:DNA-binding MarR family transcriptional regulator
VVVHVNLVVMADSVPLSPEALDLGQLAFFFGQRMNEEVLRRLHAAGFDGVRIAHGYLVQHVVEAARSVTELGERMGVTQQAASKVVAELTELGYLEQAPSDDARVRRVRLSPRGRAMLESTRRIRSRLERTLLRGASTAHVRHAKTLLIAALERLGGIDAIRTRRVQQPPEERSRRR